jgi:hypothetical protein
VSGNGAIVEAKMCTLTLESTHFIFNKCPIYSHDGPSAKFSTNSHDTDYSAPLAAIAHKMGFILRTVEIFKFNVNLLLMNNFTFFIEQGGEE